MSYFDYIDIKDTKALDKPSGTTSSGFTIPLGGIYGSNVETLIDDSISRRLLLTIDPDICQGIPTILGTRISVCNIVELRYILDWDIQKIKNEYPSLTDDQINAALEYYDEHKEEVDSYLRDDQEIDKA